MSQPTVTVIIPSISALTLPVALWSALHQPILSHDQIIVVGDGPQPIAEKVVKEFNEKYQSLTGDTSSPFEYMEYNGESCWGNPNRNFALESGLVRGNYIIFMDEDDMHMPNTFNHIRQTGMENPNKVLMYKFIHNSHGVLWQEPVIACAWIGGHCIVAPNVPEKIGRWGMRYEGDFDFIRNTVDLWGEENVVWVDAIIARCRPRAEHFWWNQ